MKPNHGLRMDLIRQKFRDPPKDLAAWVMFALVITALRLLLSRPEDLSPLPVLNTLLLPLCVWTAIPMTLVRLENRTWQYFRNTALLGLAAAAVALVCYLYIFLGNGARPDTATNRVAAILGSGLGTALSGGALGALAKYSESRPNRF